jgi:hypothetical protein
LDYWSFAMNYSICTADPATHLRIVVTALIAAIIVVWLGVAARGGELALTAAASAW